MPVTGGKAPQRRHRNRDRLGASVARNSARVMSGDAAYSAQIRAALASVVAERVSPPYGLAAALP
jgi:hypothetical protein